MSVKQAQKIVNHVDDEFGITLVAYTNAEIEAIRNRLSEFLELEVSTDDLTDPEDSDLDDELEDDLE